MCERPGIKVKDEKWASRKSLFKAFSPTWHLLLLSKNSGAESRFIRNNGCVGNQGFTHLSFRGTKRGTHSLNMSFGGVSYSSHGITSITPVFQRLTRLFTLVIIYWEIGNMPRLVAEPSQLQLMY